MTKKSEVPKLTEEEEVKSWSQPIQVVLDGIEDAQSGLQMLYRLGRPDGFDTLEALVDCNNHLNKACIIASQKLAQLSLFEPRPATQPKLPLTGEAPRDQG